MRPKLTVGGVLALVSILSACSRPLPPQPGSNVVLLSVDSLRCDRLAPWTDDGPPMPNLERLEERGTVLTNAWATAPWTAPAIVSVFTGLYPPAHGVAVRDDTTTPELPTLARMLADDGYRLGNLTFFSDISYFRNLGLPAGAPGLRHHREPAAFERFLDGGGEPFAAWIHLLEPHLPYGATGYRAREVTIPGSSGLELAQLRAEVPVGSVAFEPGDRTRLLELYDRDLEALDRSIGRIVGALERRDLLSSTIIVLLADHGEELLDHGWVGHASTAVQAKLVPEILHIPVVLTGPGVPSGVRSDLLVQQVDLLPTVCSVLGIEPPPRLDGQRLRLYPEGIRSDRRLAFFDTAVGGNLTPADRRDERLQGVTDTDCLLRRHAGLPGGNIEAHLELSDNGCPPGRVADLTAVLDRWQREQAAKRVELLSSVGGSRPTSAVVDGLDPALEVIRPQHGARLEWAPTGGRIALEWDLPQGEESTSVWVEYTTVGGPTSVDGAFPVRGKRIAFGPFPEGFWNDVAAHSPYRFRVVAPDSGVRSDWIQFQVEPAS